MTDDEIIAGVRSGDRAALEDAYALYKREVEAACALFLGDGTDLAQAVPQVMQSALEKIRAGERPLPNLKSWLECLAAAHCFEILKTWLGAFENQSRGLETLAGQVPLLKDISQDPRERVSYMVRGDIEEIAEPHRQMLKMYEMEGLQFLELAKRLNCGWLTAARRLFQAREFLGDKVKAGIKK